MDEVVPSKGDEDTAVPTAWRPTLEAVVRAFAEGDFEARGIPGVDPVDAATQQQVRDAVEDYGAGPLVELPAVAWTTSVAQWSGNKWLVYVDLSTSEGASDLVLEVKVREAGAGYAFSVWLVYVP